MKQTLIIVVALAFAPSSVRMAMAEDPIPSDAPGWAGVTNAEDVIVARQALMTEMERLMRPIDSYTVGEPADPDDLRSAGTTIAQMLLAFPHLFPPTTNLYDPDSDAPVTIALPTIWDDFPTFSTLASAAYSTATAMGSAAEAEPLKAAGVSLRAACDACHALFLRPYVPSSVTKEDLEFDFDAFFGEDSDNGGTTQ
jgi:cytochrome c556